MSENQDGKVSLRLVVAVALTAAVMGVMVSSCSRGAQSGKDIAPVANEIKAQPNTPSVPPAVIAGEAATRGSARKNTGR
jgi:hypothetical protein